jgi:hypothetical protein
LAFEIRFLQFVELNYLYLFSPETWESLLYAVETI